MKLTVNEIASILGGKVEGNGDVVISKLAKIESGEKEAISFLANPKYAAHLYSTHSSAVIISHDFTLDREVQTALIRVDDPYSAFTQLLEMAQSVRNLRTGTESPAFIHHTASLGEGVFIGAFSYVGREASIGQDVKIHQQVLLENLLKLVQEL